MEEIFKVAVRNLSHHKLRTGLTMLGVIIGIGAIVALVSLGGALTDSIDEQFEQLGSKRFIVMPKMTMSLGPPGGSVMLTDRDVDTVERVKGVKHAIPILYKMLPVEFNEEARSLGIMGMPLGEASKFFDDVMGFEMKEGRMLKTGERSSVVIGGKLATDVFSEEVRLRSKIEVMGHSLKVVGIMEEIGNTQDDTGIMIDIDFLQEITNSSDEITMIFGSVFSNPEETAQKIDDKMDDVYNNDIFDVQTVEQLADQISSVFSIISVVFLGIASISLIVAGIGIMNTMLMTVIERTKEIGIMKAIGATNKRILVIFLTESAIVGILGGAVGVGIGYLLSIAFTSVGSSFIGISMNVTIDPLLVAGAIGFSAFVGMISGTYPAYRASQLDPVDALRYE
ncbi:hypothetical protein CL614_00900 [archaeon]|nr:hypothetical protein [archaeon]|tara:strand:+ start:1 stop:1188 length:1188 start_codon:yes stop_codon:yes gene_type:complete